MRSAVKCGEKKTIFTAYFLHLFAVYAVNSGELFIFTAFLVFLQKRNFSRRVRASNLSSTFYSTTPTVTYCWRHFKSATKAIRQKEITFTTEKLRIRQNSKWSKLKIFTSWERNFVHPPLFGRENLSNPRLSHTVRIISKLLMDPTNVIASDPQVWLLALWCKFVFFYILSFSVKFLKLFIL